jgi:3'-5' exoribonuclease
MVLSHHGERERGSPVTPATLEALVLHHCDYLDAHAGAFTRIIKREGGQNRRWSEYVNLIDRHIYLPETVEDNGQPKLL